jgi:hypothetical protein
MSASLAASLVDLVRGLAIGAREGTNANRFSLESVRWTPASDGALEMRIGRLEAMGLQLASDALRMEIERVTVHDLLVTVHAGNDALRVGAIEARDAEFAGLKLHGPLVLPRQFRQLWEATHPADGTALPPPADAWQLGPLGEIDGTIRGRITDAHLLFDADVTVPIRHGLVDFNDATVEHVGPDSRMGVSPLGFYVDAPNGRSYLYQFASAPLAGVEFERRKSLIGPWISERGKLRLRPFAESMLRQGLGSQAQGLTAQARTLLGRTALSGELRLGDGLLALPGLQVSMDGHEQGLNTVVLRSESVGRGLGAEIAALSAREIAASWGSAQLAGDAVTAKLGVQVVVEGDTLRFVLAAANGRIAAPRIGFAAVEPA